MGFGPAEVIQMTHDEFRELALSLPDAVESSHMNHPDFRVNKKIFATLGCPDESFAMVKLTLEQQAEFVHDEPDIFQPVKGGWGRMGCTNVILAAANHDSVLTALATAWRRIAPKKLAERFSL